MAVPAKDCSWSWHSDGPIEEVLREKLFPSLLRGEEIKADFKQILGHSIKHGGLGISDLRSSADSAYNTSKADSRELVEYLIGGSVLNYVGHRACVRTARETVRLRKKSAELAKIFKRHEQAGVQEKNRLHRAMRNGAWIRAVPHCRNGTELYREEFWENHRLRYGLMPQDIPATCDGFGKKFLIEHALS